MTEFSENIEKSIDITVEELSEEWEDYSEEDNREAVHQESNYIVSEKASADELLDILQRSGNIYTEAQGENVMEVLDNAAYSVIQEEIRKRIRNELEE